VVAGSLALSSFALVDFVLRGGSWRDRLVRAGAPNSDYNWLATYLVLVIPVLMGWSVIQRTGVARALGLLTLLAAGFAQVAAYTRAGWLAHLAQAFGFGLMAGRQRLVIWALVGAIATGGALLAISAIGYQRDTMDPWTLSARVKTWQLGLRQVVEHPLVGVGYGNDTFLKVHAAEIEAEKAKGAEEKVLPALHNTFAMVLMGSGVPALVFFVWIMVRAIRELAPDRRQSLLREKGLLLLRTAIALAVIGFVVRNAFDYMFAGSLAFLFWILVAVGFSVKDDRSLEKVGTDEAGTH
jgi:heptosyltransferase-3/putative inorganic carbon (HCO3(-)) transporter